MKKLLILLPFLVTQVLGQIDFNNFITLQSSGKIPSDFSDLAREKVAGDDIRNENLSKKNDTQFKQNIHYSLDKIIHSGECVYGDPISNYISDVAKNLLKDDEELYSKLRFYTLKSNVANAFSTHQGIIVFTTGLISQFANETQLAFVLAHEIAHYKEEHVVQTFEWKTQNKYNRENLGQFNNYSKEKEFEADTKASQMCLDAGYSASEVYNSFDVLMFCHLPFDEIKFPLDYFNTPLFYVPVKEFGKDVFPIKMDEAYDDENSTHPNIEKRKEMIRPLLEKSFGTGQSFINSETEFNTIRNYARFESIRTNIINLELSKALYQIFLLEKEFPNNFALERMKCHAWVGLLNAKNNGYWSDVVVNKKELEGESAILYQYLRKLDKYALAAHTLRTLEDASKKYPENEELKKLYNSSIYSIASNSIWSWSKYSDIPFQEAFTSNKETKDTLSNETVTEVTNTDKESLSKYDRIKGTGTGKNTSTNSVIADSANYFLFGISDLITSKSVINTYNNYQTEINKKKEQENIKKKNSEKIKIIENKLIVVEPTTYYYLRNKHDFSKSDVYQNKLIDAITDVAQKQNIKIFDYSTNTLDQGGTALFNQRSTVMNYLKQYANLNENTLFVPVDYELIQGIQQKCGTNKVLFTWTEYWAGDRSIVGNIITGILVPPTLPLMTLNAVGKYNTCKFVFAVIDMEAGKLDYTYSNTMKSSGGSLVLKSAIYNLFNVKK